MIRRGSIDQETIELQAEVADLRQYLTTLRSLAEQEFKRQMTEHPEIDPVGLVTYMAIASIRSGSPEALFRAIADIGKAEQLVLLEIGREQGADAVDQERSEQSRPGGKARAEAVRATMPTDEEILAAFDARNAPRCKMRAIADTAKALDISELTVRRKLRERAK